ncbi:nucleotidyltransferase domain-containing protein [Candidatus Pacearchaeota archaeon]|nr:nucleotidyltransferase domain-containing protein [Candidatus Pacearchaeota archaeon]MBI2057242.1 nucleotidyltransferase domain-containing protein [Candidatus Pacearchaeota archaeon]
MIKSKIFTKKELEVVNKKMKNKKLTQVDSNYLTRFIRPKLNEMASIDSKFLLDKMEYNQKIKSIEERIKKIILGSIKDVQAIVIYGSAIQTNYKDYKDIDILIVIKNKINLKEKYRKIIEIKKILSEYNIKADLEIYNKKTIEKSYSRSPSLIYQLKDKKIIYGGLNLNNKIELYNIDLKMKLDWSNLENNPEGIEIYKALRNAMLVKLLINRIVDNKRLKESLSEEIGKNLLERLKNNQESNFDRKTALGYLNILLEQTEKEIGDELWEKIKL